MKKSVLNILLILGFVNLAQTQITSIKYLIEYNENTSYYDCKIVIEDGQSTTYPQRIQYNSQYSVVVPTGATLSIEQLHNPLENNNNYTGTIPCLWDIGPKEISPPTQPENDFHTVFPNLSPPSAYHDLFEGDTVTLFSLNINVDPCDNLVRPFEIGVDPGSIDMPSGGDFSCGFALSGGLQIYSGNLTTPYKNQISQNDTLIICLDECLELKPTLPCIEENDLAFEWSTGESTLNIDVCPTESTTYYLLVKDSLDTILDSLSLYIDINTIILELNDLEICVNTNTIVTSSIPGGTWQVTNPSVASIDVNTGVITGVSAGEVKIKYLAPNGWTKITETLIVHERPTIVVPDFICIGGETNLSSNTEGVWTSSDPSVASVIDIGVLEGIATGSVSIEFTDTSSYCSTIVDIEILEEEFVTNLGSDSICSGETTVLFPNSGGQWTISYSSVPYVATYTNSGVVTGIYEGKVVFSFNSNVPGCGVSDTDTIYVFDLPPVEYLGDDRICIGNSTSIPPNEGAAWENLDPTVASIDVNTGIITGLAQGSTVFTIIDTITGCSAKTSALIVDPWPTVSAEFISLCIGGTGLVSPTAGGVWTAIHPEIADLDSILVTGVAEGIAGFLYTTNATGCVSDTLFITIMPQPSTNINGPNEICIGETTNLEPSVGGTWSTSDPNIALVDNFGTLTGVSSGKVVAVFTDATTLCTYESSDTITVLPNPFEAIIGSIKLCVGETLQFYPNTFVGFWASDNPNVLTVDSLTGHITAISKGIASISFTEDSTGCSSSINLEVFDIPLIVFVGDNEICVGESTIIAPISGGYVATGNPSIAVIDNLGNAIGMFPGTTTITITDYNTGCSSEPLLLTVLPASDPSCIVSTKDHESQNIKLYPNPAKDFINVESESIIESVSIYSLGYQKLKEEVHENGTNSVQVLTTGISQGLYLIALKTNGTTYYKKLIIE
jgi:uncharacterized protein YjdB